MNKHFVIANIALDKLVDNIIKGSHSLRQITLDLPLSNTEKLPQGRLLTADGNSIISQAQVALTIPVRSF